MLDEKGAQEGQVEGGDTLTQAALIFDLSLFLLCRGNQVCAFYTILIRPEIGRFCSLPNSPLPVLRFLKLLSLRSLIRHRERAFGERRRACVGAK